MQVNWEYIEQESWSENNHGSWASKSRVILWKCYRALVLTAEHRRFVLKKPRPCEEIRAALRYSQFTWKIKYENNNYRMKYCRVLNMNMCRLKLLNMNISECNISEYIGNTCGKMRNEWSTWLGCVSKETMCNSARQNMSTVGQACGLHTGPPRWSDTVRVHHHLFRSIEYFTPRYSIKRQQQFRNFLFVSIKHTYYLKFWKATF